MKIQPADTGIFPASTRQAENPRPQQEIRTDARHATSATESENLSPKEAQALVNDMNKSLQSINTGLQFSLQEDTGKIVVKVIDLETKETLRQFPSEEAIAVARALDKLKGVLVRQSA